jgi:iduronate 2-sulfatase
MRKFLPILVLLSLFSCKKDEPHPNILFISVDDLRPELGCYGNEFVKTPNIDSFALDGMVFARAYCQTAVCAPSRASMMLGMRPDSTRVWHLGDEFRKINPDAVTMPQYFSKYGYYTVNIGKIFHNYMPDSISWDEPDLRPFPYGESENLLRDGETFYVNRENQDIQRTRRDSMLAIRKITYADGWNCGPVVEIGKGGDSDYIDGAQTDLAIETLKRIKNLDKPFYLALGYYRPHLPFAAPEKYWNLYDRAEIPLPPSPKPPVNSPAFALNSMYELRAYAGTSHKSHPLDGTIGEDTTRLLKHGYLASVSYIDACIGRLFNAMKEMDIYDNTIIVIWGDHGWKLGDHGSWGKMTNYEWDTHVPLIVKNQGMGLSLAGRSDGLSVSSNYSSTVNLTNGIVELLDVFPSLCEMAGIPVEAYLQGESFVPLLENPEFPWKEAAFSQFHRRPKVAYDGGRYMGYSVQTKDLHYIQWHTWDDKLKVAGDSVTAELYDHRIDRYESVNRIDDENYADDLVNLSYLLKNFTEKNPRINNRINNRIND